MTADGKGAAPDWETPEPEQVGMAPDLRERLDALVRDGRAPRLHGVVALRDGRLALEWYGAGDDWSWGTPHGHVMFGPETLHDLRSVTKSITSLLYGIALEQGRVPPPEAPLLAQFPEYSDLASDERKTALRIEHALTMTLGLEWREDLPYTSAKNSEIAMEMAPDRYRYVLERPIVDAPGKVWHYCGGATALIGAIIERGTGMKLQDFARASLFSPLGIEAFEWMTGSDGVASPASGLRLTPRGLARVGECVAAGGRWDGGEIVPRRWLEAAHTPRVTIAAGFDYGYQWYLGESKRPVAGSVRWAAGQGNGGQRLLVAPDFSLVVAITCGAYDSADQMTTPGRVINLVLSSLIR
jgi:CubicO group peptidase (beta-lactamase class C family)